MKRKTKYYGFALPIDMYNAIDRMAKKLGVTKKMVIMLALDKFFNNNEKGGEK